MVSERERFPAERSFCMRRKEVPKRRGTVCLFVGEKIAANLEQECSIGSRGENRGDAKRTKLKREAW